MLPLIEDGSYRMGPAARRKLLRTGGLLGLLLIACLASLSATERASAEVYWTASTGTPGVGTIGRASDDGDGVVPNLIPVASTPTGIAVDSDHIFWANRSPASIGRANRDGSNVNPSFIEDPSIVEPAGVAVTSSHIYWLDAATEAIGRAALDGSSVQATWISLPPAAIGGSYMNSSIAIGGDHIYWTYQGTSPFASNGSIGRAKLDGTAVNGQFIPDRRQPKGLTVDDTYLYWSDQGGSVGDYVIARYWLNDPYIDEYYGEYPARRVVAGGLALRLDYLFFTWPDGGSVGRFETDGTGGDLYLVENLGTPWGIATSPTKVILSNLVLRPIRRTFTSPAQGKTENFKLNAWVSNDGDADGVATVALKSSSPRVKVPAVVRLEVPGGYDEAKKFNATVKGPAPQRVKITATMGTRTATSVLRFKR